MKLKCSEEQFWKDWGSQTSHTDRGPLSRKCYRKAVTSGNRWLLPECMKLSNNSNTHQPSFLNFQRPNLFLTIYLDASLCLTQLSWNELSSPGTHHMWDVCPRDDHPGKWIPRTWAEINPKPRCLQHGALAAAPLEM